MEKEKLQSVIYAKIDELPTLSAVIPRIVSLMDDPSADAHKITEAISHDPALTSKILKVANSAYYGFPQKITSLERAVALLGFNMVKSLAVSIGVIKSLPSKGLSEIFSIQDLWVHSLAVATAMKVMVGKRDAKEKEEGETLFIVGLLHDLGKIILAQFFPEDFAAALELSNSDPRLPLYESERQIIGIDHSEVGGMLLSRWKFPDLIVVPITQHHSLVEDKSEYAKETTSLRIADVLAQEAAIGNGGNGAVPELSKEELDLLQLGGEEVEKVKEELLEAKEGIYSFFQSIQ